MVGGGAVLVAEAEAVEGGDEEGVGSEGEEEGDLGDWVSPEEKWGGSFGRGWLRGGGSRHFWGGVCVCADLS